ncbi:MAG: hypothetical protein JNM62_12985 [Flavobacteriales bacterium]|nr:hypothetical protein [Flavobacteriales bacterium]
MRSLGTALLLVLNIGLVRAQSDTATVHIMHGADCDAWFSLERMRSLPQHTATVTSKDGETHHYRGALLQRVLSDACPSIAAMDKHARTRAAVKVTASDDFTAVLGAMELDSTFKARPVLLAWERDGAPLDGHFGPFQLIVPEDLRHSRNVRNVSRVELINP